MIMGFEPKTLKPIGRQQSIEYCIQTILTTPIGSRELVRSFGSRLIELVDNTGTEAFKIDVIKEVHEALTLWEPRITSIKLDSINVSNGKLSFILYYQDKETNIINKTIIAA